MIVNIYIYTYIYIYVCLGKYINIDRGSVVVFAHAVSWRASAASCPNHITLPRSHGGESKGLS